MSWGTMTVHIQVNSGALCLQTLAFKMGRRKGIIQPIMLFCVQSHSQSEVNVPDCLINVTISYDTSTFLNLVLIKKKS